MRVLTVEDLERLKEFAVPVMGFKEERSLLNSGLKNKGMTVLKSTGCQRIPRVLTVLILILYLIKLVVDYNSMNRRIEH